MPETGRDMILIKRIALVIIIGLLIYFMALTVFIPVSRFRIEIPEEKPDHDKIFRPDLNWELTFDDSIKNKAIALISRESYLLSRLEMTNTDSISMAISLKDSIVALVVQGVTIYSTKIQSFEVSNAINKTDPFILAHWLSWPFIVDNHYSSIAKAPVLYKKAPKDTIEAMSQLEIDPFKDDLDPVFITLIFDRKLALNIKQSEIPEKGNLKQLRIYKRLHRAIIRKDIFAHLIRFTPIEIVPEVTIVIDKRAARVIYRALPGNALVAVQLQTQ